MKIVSKAFEEKGEMSEVYTCDGEGINPPLEFLDIPESAKSLVLIMEDPDVPREIREDGMWNHWLVWNIPPNKTVINENSKPEGVVGRNTDNSLGYYPPCPPNGEHRYFFKLYALSTELDLEKGATREDLLFAMKGFVIDMAETVALYGGERRR